MGVFVRAAFAGMVAAVVVIVIGIVVGDLLFRMHRISNEAAAWYGLNFFLPASVVGLAVFLYR